MPYRHLLFEADAREKVLRGASAIADAVRVTLGPRSHSVLIEKKWGAPIVCNDGVTIAKEFSLKDPDENLGAQMLRGAAERTGDSVGDGTTTATLLAHAILADGIRNIAAGASGGISGSTLARASTSDLIEAGIIDSTKVVRLALENAVSVAGVLLLTEATMNEVPEQHVERPPAAVEGY